MNRWFALVLLLAGVSPAQDVARMEQLVNSYVSSNRFMGSVLVARDDQVLFSKGFGSASLEWDVPNSPSTKFRIGSVTKQFTSASILLLEERGKLSVSDPVKKYLPDASAAWDNVTILHLLTHTSGIPSFTDLPEYTSLKPFASPVEKTVARFRDKPLEFAPGEKWKYSNSGYVLLGYILEKVSGQSYEKFVQENIFTPLGMKDSGYDSTSTIIRHRAAGYAPGSNGPVNAGFIHMSIPHAAGALYSTTEDLLRWERGLFGGKLLSKASLDKMTTPYKNNYAFGVTVHTVNGHKVIDHGGGIEGFNSFLAYYPEDKMTVAVLANLNGPAAQEIAPRLAAAARGEKIELPSERKEIAVSPKVLSEYVGTYELTPNMNISITLAGEQLMIRVTGQPKIPLYAQSETQFFVKVVDARVDFLKDDKGAVTALVLHQGGRDTRAPRISSTVQEPPERKAIVVTAETLRQFAGTYEIRPGFDLVVTLEGDQLMTQATGQPKFRIYPETETKYFVKEFDAQLDFVKDDKGAVTGIVLHQAGQDVHAPRK